MKTAFCALLVAVLCLTAVCGMGAYSTVFASKKQVPIYRVQTNAKKVAISFDAAWGADQTRNIMDVCDSYGIKATFFLVGFWCDKYPHLVAEISSRGFEIGTHSLTHPQMSKLSQDACRAELVESCKKISAVTGKPVTLFRPPFGDYNNTLLSTATSLGLYTIQWSVDSLDWKGLSALQIATRVQKAEQGDVILCHNNSDHVVEALPYVFQALQAKGLTACPVGQLIHKEGYVIRSDGTQVLLAR